MSKKDHFQVQEPIPVTHIHYTGVSNHGNRITLKNLITNKIKNLWYDPMLRSELSRLSLTSLFFTICTGLMTVAQIQSDRWFDTYNRARNVLALQQHLAEPEGMEMWARDPLHDWGFEWLPNLTGWRGWLPDALLNSLLILTVLSCLCFPAQRRIKYQSIVLLRRFLWCLSVLYLFRMCSFMVTTVPSPLKGCMPKYVPSASTAKDEAGDYLVLMGKMMSGAVTACTDNIYSGHTTLISLLVASSVVYSGRWYVGLLNLLIGIVALLAIAATRLHYTVDILIALLVACFLFAMYHYLVIIYADKYMLYGGQSQRAHSITASTAIQDARVLAEKSLAGRIVPSWLGLVIWWCDGLDIRIGPYNTMSKIGTTSTGLVQEQEALKRASRVSLHNQEGKSPMIIEQRGSFYSLPLSMHQSMISEKI